MTTNDKSIQGAFGEGSHSDDRGSYMKPVRLHCKADGCRVPPSILENPDTGEGVCGFHMAVDSDNWGRATRFIQRPEFRSLLKAIDDMTAFSFSDKCFDTKLEDAYIAAVQRAALAAGIDRDKLARRTLKSWSGEEFKECARVYRDRVLAAAEARVAEVCAGNKSANQTAVMAAAAEALKALTGKAAIMGGPA